MVHPVSLTIDANVRRTLLVANVNTQLIGVLQIKLDSMVAFGVWEHQPA